MYLETFLRMDDDALLHMWSGKQLIRWNDWFAQVEAQLKDPKTWNKWLEFNRKCVQIRKQFKVITCACGYQTPIGTDEGLLRNHYFDGHECINKTVIPIMPGMNN